MCIYTSDQQRTNYIQTQMILFQIKCKNVIILTARNILELDEQWNCLIELMISDGALATLQPFVSRHLTTNLTDVSNSVFHYIFNILSLENLGVHTQDTLNVLFQTISFYLLDC